MGIPVGKLALYVDQYGLFGDPEVLPSKVIWAAPQRTTPHTSPFVVRSRALALPCSVTT